MKGEIVGKVREFLERTPVASTATLSRLVGKREYAYVLLNLLERRGEIRRITRGYYTIHEDPTLLVYCLKPAYLGLQDAMSLHNLWEQETIPIIITCRRVRSGLREVFDHNVMVRRISPKYFFGIEDLERGGFFFPVSDVEKTFIDLVYFGEMDGGLARRFKGKLNLKKLEAYLERYPERLRRRAMGFFSF